MAHKKPNRKSKPSNQHINAVRSVANKFLSDPLSRKFWPNPKGFPDVVYKYRDWKIGYHQNLLFKGELYMSPAKFFNDPFDCKIYRNMRLLNTPEKIKKHMDKSMIDLADYVSENYQSPEEARNIFENRTSDMIMYQVREEYYEDLKNNSKYGTACFSRRWDSILMWAHYANNHSGICIGFDQRKLEIHDSYCKGDFVDYVKEYPIIHPDEGDTELARKRTFIKHEMWSNEEEYRLMKVFTGDAEVPHDSSRRIITLPIDYIVEIILGVSMLEDEKEKIIKFGKEQNIPVYYASKIPFKFEIDRFEVE